jgi:hypothetical protein
MPVMNIIILLILFEDHVGVPVVELAEEFFGLSNRFELLDPINFESVYASLCKESISFFLKLLYMYV